MNAIYAEESPGENNRMQLPPFQDILKAWFPRGTARILCWVVFFLPFALYFLIGWDQLLDRPPTLDVGIVTVAAALGGLVLNAGTNLKGSKRKETIQVAQKFIAVVVLIIIFLPALHFVELMGSIDVNEFQPDSAEAWIRGFFFWIGAISFYAGISLFIVALVDLVYAMIDMDKLENASGGDNGVSAQNVQDPKHEGNLTGNDDCKG